jgi:molybdopterin/thiamine biosynthesis adenylyltransferase
MNAIEEIESCFNSRGVKPAPLSARLPRFIGAPPAADEKLRGLKVMLVGCGAVGGPIAIGLARMHIDTIWLLDKGKFKTESLLTHCVWPQDICKPKAATLGCLIKDISPDSRVFAYNGAVETVDLLAMADADLVILATDNLRAEIEVGQRCLCLGIPLIHAAVHGDTLVAQVRFFANREDSACPACGYSLAEWSALNRQTKYSCDLVDLKTADAKIFRPPTMSVSFLCSVAADLALMQILRQTLGAAVENTLLEYCGFTHRTVISSLKRNLNCPCDHARYDRASTLRPLPNCTPRELTEMAGCDSSSGFNRISLKVAGLSYCESGGCKCNGIRPFRQFLAPGDPTLRCRSCGDTITPLPFYTHDPVPLALIADQMGCRLRDMGVESTAWVMVRGPQRNMIFISKKLRRMKQ